MPLVMYHIEDFKKKKQITALCRQLGFQVRELKRTDGDKTVGLLAGMPKGALGLPRGQEVSAGSMPKDFRMPELLVFAAMPEEQLDAFLDAYKKAGILPVALKAVVTEYNKDWSLYALVRELLAEHTAAAMRTI